MNKTRMFNTRRHSIFSVALLLFVYFQSPCFAEHHGTFIRPRSVTYDQTFELGMTNYERFHNVDQQANTFFTSISPLFIRSIRSESVASFLLPNQGRCSRVREDGQGDIGSLWLELISSDGSSFDGAFCIDPLEQTIGLYWLSQFNLDKITPGLWMSLSTSIIQVERNLRLCEQLSKDLGTLVGLQTITQALNNPDWDYGKWPTHSIKKGGFDDIMLKLGYVTQINTILIGAYLMGGIPTGNASDALYVFEPIVGSKNGSLGCGFKADYTQSLTDDRTITLMSELRYRYAFASTERRSYDLCNQGVWSRYLQVVSSDEPYESSSGINQFTSLVNVTPGSSIDWWTAATYNTGCMFIEFGYDFWAQQAERICTNSCFQFPTDTAILDIAGLCGSATCASTVNISQSNQPPNKATSASTFIPLQINDANLMSAASPTQMSSTLYVAASCPCNLNAIAMNLGIATSFEIAHVEPKNNRWALWGQLNVSF